MQVVLPTIKQMRSVCRDLRPPTILERFQIRVIRALHPMDISVAMTGFGHVWESMAEQMQAVERQSAIVTINHKNIFAVTPWKSTRGSMTACRSKRLWFE